MKAFTGVGNYYFKRDWALSADDSLASSSSLQEEGVRSRHLSGFADEVIEDNSAYIHPPHVLAGGGGSSWLWSSQTCTATSK